MNNMELALEHCKKKYRKIHIGNDDLWGAEKSGFLSACEIKDAQIKELVEALEYYSKIDMCVPEQDGCHECGMDKSIAKEALNKYRGKE